MSEVIRYGANAPKVPAWAEARLRKYMRAAGVTSVLVTSTFRSPQDQARIMLKAIQDYGMPYNRNLYGSIGDKVLDGYNSALPDGVNITTMAAIILSLGPKNVSRHCSTDTVVLDVAPSSIPGEKRAGFLDGLQYGKSVGEIRELIWPPKDVAFHIEFIPGVPDHPIIVRPGMNTGGIVAALLLVGGLWLLRG